MAALSPNRIAWTYTDDDGTDYRVAAQKAITDQAKAGGAAAATSVPLKPLGLKMRRMNCTDGSGHTRGVVCYETDCDLWTTPGTAINLNYLNNSTAFSSNGVKRKEQIARRSGISESA